MSQLNETHQPQLKSWVDSANNPSGDFPIQNLPLGVFRRQAADEAPRVGAAIGDQIFDITAAAQADLFQDSAAAAVQACRFSSLNALMSLGRPQWKALRSELSRLLRDGGPAAAHASRVLVPQEAAEMGLPANSGDYTDFYASVHHATNVGSMFRPDNPLLPNYKHIPVGYHGRASSLVASGTPVKRPQGQTKADDAEAPVYGPSKLLDYELEVGFYVGPGNDLGAPIPIDRAQDHIFGLCLVNDWSARDIQKWEYQPLGPFLAKSFATTVSPWVVTLDALEPYRMEALKRPAGDPQPLPHLDSPFERNKGGIGLTVEAY
ncbi:MAG TPA: fumarylacetoacetase, partial [Acidobacteriota bacterium]|nr:fumarylacetoacetase [Acidobacteriota bacterium]